MTGVVGDDNVGSMLLSQLRERKIETEGIIIERGRPTTLKTRIVAHGQQVVRFDKESRKPIPPESVQKILNYVKSLRERVNTVIVSDYNKGVVSKELMEGIKNALKDSGISICVDPKQNDFALYDGAYIITPNHHEAQRAVGMEISDEKDVLTLGEMLLKKYDFQSVLITRGEEGMSLFERGKKVLHSFFPAQAKEVYDVTGAGDTVIGVLALGIAAKASLKEATCLANLAAGIVVGKVGTAAVSKEELINAL